jgi:hypothetical protein
MEPTAWRHKSQMYSTATTGRMESVHNDDEHESPDAVAHGYRAYMHTYVHTYITITIHHLLEEGADGAGEGSPIDGLCRPIRADPESTDPGDERCCYCCTIPPLMMKEYCRATTHCSEGLF